MCTLPLRSNQPSLHLDNSHAEKCLPYYATKMYFTPLLHCAPWMCIKTLNKHYRQRRHLAITRWDRHAAQPAQAQGKIFTCIRGMLPKKQLKDDYTVSEKSGMYTVYHMIKPCWIALRFKNTHSSRHNTFRKKVSCIKRWYSQNSGSVS